MSLRYKSLPCPLVDETRLFNSNFSLLLGGWRDARAMTYPMYSPPNLTFYDYVGVCQCAKSWALGYGEKVRTLCMLSTYLLHTYIYSIG